MQDLSRATPVTIRLGPRTITGTVRAVGEALHWPAAADAPSRRLRHVVLDLGEAGAPVELWLAEEDPALSPPPSRS
ncbi:hypothetical protein [Methylobacterium oryzisoli]|uniref:hypothetical protein n=1 Tax=Methylobacterium oryzisoli TaxID=3385502 RepID=UPI00389250C0